jgi:hypothetical protein
VREKIEMILKYCFSFLSSCFYRLPHPENRGERRYESWERCKRERNESKQVPEEGIFMNLMPSGS